MAQPDEATIEDVTDDEQALIDLIHASGYTIATPVVRDGGWYITIVHDSKEFRGHGDDRFIALGAAADAAGLA